TDHDELGGAVAFAQAADDVGLGGIIGAEITVRHEAPPDADDSHLVLLAATREGYANLSTIITRARMESGRGQPGVSLDVVARHAAGLFALTGCPRGWVPRRIARGDPDGACEAAATLLDIFAGQVAIECWDHGLDDERRLVPPLMAIARALDIPWVVTNDVHYAEPRGRIVHDVLVSLRHQRTLDTMGTRLRPNGEWYLKSARQMARRWQQYPEGLRATRDTADEYLARLVEAGAAERIPGFRDAAAYRAQIAHELDIIRKLGMAGYFLIVWDIVRFSRRE